MRIVRHSQCFAETIEAFPLDNAPLVWLGSARDGLARRKVFEAKLKGACGRKLPLFRANQLGGHINIEVRPYPYGVVSGSKPEIVGII